MKPLRALLSFVACVLSMSAFAADPYRDPTQPIETRVQDLLARLTLEEKVSLMKNTTPGVPRLGIPKYDWWNESLHGVARAGEATVFPQAIGLAAMWDDALMKQIAHTIGVEARAKFAGAAGTKDEGTRYYGLTFWTPNINIFRDPRWGRGQETYGEDPFLTATLGVAFVKGLQGNDPHYLKVAACAKHFAVHSGPERLRHEFNAKVSMKDMWDTYLPAFHALVNAKVEAVMCAYNRTNDEPCCGNTYLLQDVLRGQWKFKGHVVSDCWALADFWQGHKVVKDGVEAAALALNKGVNLNCGSTYYPNLIEAVKRGLVTEAQVDS